MAGYPTRLMEEDNDEEMDLFENHVRPYYKTNTSEEDLEVRNFLSLYAEKAMKYREKGTSGTNGDRLDCFIEDDHPLDLLIPDGEGKLAPFSHHAGDSFWKKPKQAGGMVGFGAMERQFFFAAAKDYDCFQGVKDAERGEKGQHQPLKQGPSFLRSKNIISDEMFFNENIPVGVASCIIDSVEFQSIFADLSVMQGQERSFQDVPSELNNELYFSGLHFVRVTETPGREVVIEYSMDPSFKTKLEEKRQRKEERIEKLSIRAMAKADRTRQRYMPKTQVDPLVSGRSVKNNTGKPLAPDGDLLSESSSDEDSDEDAEMTEFTKFVSQKVGSSSTIGNGEEMMSPEVSNIISHDEVAMKLSEFSRHTRMPLSYNLTDYNIRQFLDVHLRVIITLTKEPVNEQKDGSRGQSDFLYYINQFFFYVAHRHNREKSKT